MRLKLREGTGAVRVLQHASVLLAALAIACGRSDRSAGASPSTRDSSDSVLPGIDVLLRDSLHLVTGRRVGLITNQTGSTASGVSSIDALAGQTGVELVALFSPEHGIRGAEEGGLAIGSSTDAATGLPIRSLYGETRQPTAGMLADIDVLVFDIQDIGARYYTYVSTMALAMEAAGRSGLPFIVLDRPNPIGGTAVHGNVLDPAFASFVGMYPVPMRHGMTAGELARMIRGRFGVVVELTVVPAAGWHRDLWYDATGLPWIRPSPNMPDIESATHYPGTCLFEGTNLSVGRGTDRAFQQIGAPWLDADAVVTELSSMDLPGVRIEPVRFTPAAPGDGKYDGIELNGIRFAVTDRAVYDPVRTAVAAMIAIRGVNADFEFRNAGFDRLAGTDRLRARIESGEDLESILASWAAPLAAFKALREPYLLYD